MRCLLLSLLAFSSLLTWAAPLPTVLRVVDIRWEKGQPELETWLGALQGLVNRTGDDTVVFMVRDDDDAQRADMLVRMYHLEKEVVTPGALLDEMRPRLTGQVLYAPSQPWTRNAALTAAAQAPGMVLATDTDLGLPTVLDLRDRRDGDVWTLQSHRKGANATTLALAPDSVHLLADLITARKLLTIGVSSPESLLDEALASYNAGVTVLCGSDDPAFDNDALAATLTRLRGNRATPLLPAALCNLSCFARFPVTRPLVQSRDDLPPAMKENSLVLIYDGSEHARTAGTSLTYATGMLARLLDDPDLVDLPVGVEVPTTLLDFAPALAQALIARQRMTAVELIAAPGSDATRARTLDLAGIGVRGDGGDWPTTASLNAAVGAGWRGVIIHPSANPQLPEWFQHPELLKMGTPFFIAGRVHSPAELRQALQVVKGPLQVLLLDPDGVPPTALRTVLAELEATHTLLTPSQAFRSKVEFDAVNAMMAQKRARGIKQPQRGKPTLSVSAPVTTLKTLSPAAAIPLGVKITGTAPVLAARVLYRGPDNRLCTADLTPVGGGMWATVLPPMLTGGSLTVSTRVVEQGECGVSRSERLVLAIPGSDRDRDSADDVLEDYLGSNPDVTDTDGDGLADGVDDEPLLPDRPTITLFPPIAPPADAAELRDAGASRATAGGREVPPGTSVRYRIPLIALPVADAALRLRTTGAGSAAINGSAPVPLNSAEETITTLPVTAAQLAGGELDVALTAGAKPLLIASIGLTTGIDGPYLRSVEFIPDSLPAGVPIVVRVTAFAPRGVKTVRLRYGPTPQALATLALTPDPDGHGSVFAGQLPKQRDGTVLVYGAEAEDTAGHVTATPYRMAPVGLTMSHNVTLRGSDDLQGNWTPAPVWGRVGRVAPVGEAADSHLFLARPGRYVAWLLCRPRERGITVTVLRRGSLTDDVKRYLTYTIPAHTPDGWQRVGAFSVDESERLTVRVEADGERGYCAYGELVLTQDARFVPPLPAATIDWYNTLTLLGLEPGQRVDGKVTLTVQATGNLNGITVTVSRASTVPGQDAFPCPKQPDGTYLLDPRTLKPGAYLVTATGYRVVTENGKRVIDALLDTRVRVIVPDK